MTEERYIQDIINLYQEECDCVSVTDTMKFFKWYSNNCFLLFSEYLMKTMNAINLEDYIYYVINQFCEQNDQNKETELSEFLKWYFNNGLTKSFFDFINEG